EGRRAERLEVAPRDREERPATAEPAAPSRLPHAVDDVAREDDAPCDVETHRHGRVVREHLAVRRDREHDLSAFGAAAILPFPQAPRPDAVAPERAREQREDAGLVAGSIGTHAEV